VSQVYGVLDRSALVAELIRDEGLRLRPYVDSVGKTTIGIGRNLTDVGISRDEATLLLEHDIDRACRGLDELMPWWKGLDDVRQRVLVNMSFNLGIAVLMGFHNTLQAVREARWQDAHDGMLASLWAHQVGDRAKRLAEMMLTGRCGA
jgi:lysozyme